MMRSAPLYLLIASVFCGLPGCDPSDPCDPGQYADHGACYPRATDDDDASVLDASSSDAETGTPSYAGFGEPCDDADDCGGAAPACGAPMSPVCTAVNCLGKPSVCPPSWTCLDVSAFSPDPSVMSACVKL